MRYAHWHLNKAEQKDRAAEDAMQQSKIDLFLDAFDEVLKVREPQKYLQENSNNQNITDLFVRSAARPIVQEDRQGGDRYGQGAEYLPSSMHHHP